MKSVAGLIVRLERAQGPDRRLDAEVYGLMLGPQGCSVAAEAGLDGWDVNYAADFDGHAPCWTQAEDVPGLTAFMDEACAVISKVRPQQAASLMARSLRGMADPERPGAGQDLASRAARAMLVELLRAVAAEGGSADATLAA